MVMKSTTGDERQYNNRKLHLIENISLKTVWNFMKFQRLDFDIRIYKRKIFLKYNIHIFCKTSWYLIT